ncbi:hypothetical protein [Lactobacillus sp. ESL0234]|uniref:hypothetical protein n=1 Tax=Lactobacillus sp. ESL0234 TaxID=2069355 RepID=UPI0011C445D4|nr:hypothetical protein [Lactobacillus sp. ESL0234]
MFKRLQRPLKITTEKGTIEVNEPLIVTTHPAITFQNGGGGDVPIYQAIWVSRTAGYRKNTAVLDVLSGVEYKVTSITENTNAKLIYYQLTKDKEESNANSADNQRPADWY